MAGGLDLVAGFVAAVVALAIAGSAAAVTIARRDPYGAGISKRPRRWLRRARWKVRRLLRRGSSPRGGARPADR